MRPVRSAIFFAFALAVLGSKPSSADSSRWTFAAGGGYVSGYVHQYAAPTRFLLGTSAARSASLPATWTGSVSARRRLSERMSLLLEASYLPFGGGFESLHTTDPQPVGTLEAHFATVGAGARFIRSTPNWRTRVFLDVEPLAIWSEYESSTERGSGGSTTPERRSARAFLPGLSVGAGFGGPVRDRLGYEIGIRYLRSADPDTRAIHDAYFASDMKGLSTFVLGFSITLSP